MCGLSVKITDVIDDTFTEISDEDKKITFSFVDSDYDEKAGVLEEKLGTDVYDIISKLKEIHDKAQVAEIMKIINICHLQELLIMKNTKKI